MKLSITSSPCADGSHSVSNDDGLVDRLRAALPEYPSGTGTATSPERHDLTCQFGADDFIALANVGIYPSRWNILDGVNAEDAAELVSSSDLLILSGGHVPTQAAFFWAIALDALLPADLPVHHGFRGFGISEREVLPGGKGGLCGGVFPRIGDWRREMKLFITSTPFEEGSPNFSNANGFVDRLRAAPPE